MNYREEGFWVARGILTPKTDVQPLLFAVQRLVDDLLPFYGESSDHGRFGERLSLLLRKSRGRAMDHIDPVLNLFTPDYSWHPDYPTAQLPELFRHMRNDKILDALEPLLGQEITVSPIYHFNLKLGFRDREYGAKERQLSSDRRWLYQFHTGQTGWHADAPYGLRDAYDSDIVIAWTPLSRATHETSCLHVLPGSHRNDTWRKPSVEFPLESALALETVPGDVIFMDHRLLHAAPINKAAEEVRYSCNVRYLPTGQATGRPFLPGFVARSRSRPERELNSAEVWSEIWAAALENLVRCELPLPHSKNISLEDAQAITRRWKELVPDETGWLSLRERPSRPLGVRLLRQLIVTLRRWHAALRTLTTSQ